MNEQGRVYRWLDTYDGAMHRIGVAQAWNVVRSTIMWAVRPLAGVP